MGHFRKQGYERAGVCGVVGMKLRTYLANVPEKAPQGVLRKAISVSRYTQRYPLLLKGLDKSKLHREVVMIRGKHGKMHKGTRYKKYKEAAGDAQRLQGGTSRHFHRAMREGYHDYSGGSRQSIPKEERYGARVKYLLERRHGGGKARAGEEWDEKNNYWKPTYKDSKDSSYTDDLLVKDLLNMGFYETKEIAGFAGISEKQVEKIKREVIVATMQHEKDEKAKFEAWKKGADSREEEAKKRSKERLAKLERKAKADPSAGKRREFVYAQAPQIQGGKAKLIVPPQFTKEAKQSEGAKKRSDYLTSQANERGGGRADRIGGDRVFESNPDAKKQSIRHATAELDPNKHKASKVASLLRKQGVTITPAQLVAAYEMWGSPLEWHHAGLNKRSMKVEYFFKNEEAQDVFNSFGEIKKRYNEAVTTTVPHVGYEWEGKGRYRERRIAVRRIPENKEGPKGFFPVTEEGYKRAKKFTDLTLADGEELVPEDFR